MVGALRNSNVPAGVGLAVLVFMLSACTAPGKKTFPALTEGMGPEAVQGLWGQPSAIQEYDDSDGHHLRWAYYRSAVGDQRYWSLEPQPIAHGYTTTVVRRGRPYTQTYLAAWVVFTEGKAVRWQRYGPPLEEPAWMRSDRDVHRWSSRSTFP